MATLLYQTPQTNSSASSTLSNYTRSQSYYATSNITNNNLNSMQNLSHSNTDLNDPAGSIYNLDGCKSLPNKKNVMGFIFISKKTIIISCLKRNLEIIFFKKISRFFFSLFA